VSAVSQLSTLGIKIGLRFYRVGWSGEDRDWFDLDEQVIGS
jgi:hypothetical protein